MAAHAPWGAGNDLPQAKPIRIFFYFIFFVFFAGMIDNAISFRNFTYLFLVLLILLLTFDVISPQ